MSGAQKALGIGLGAVAAGVATYFVAAEHSAAELQTAMATVQVNANLTGDAAAAMGQQIEEAAVGTTASATDMARALGPIAGELRRIQGGSLDAASATEVLSSAQDLAAGSGTSLRSTTKAITDLLLVYHKHAEDAASVSDSLQQAHADLGIGVDRLAMMLQRLQPRIAGSGVDMQHLLGIVRELAPAVGSGQRAMMMVGNILSILQNPSKAAQSALASLGVTLTDSTGKFVGFSKAVDLIKGAYDQLPAAVGKTAASQRLAKDEAMLAKLATEASSKAVTAHKNALTADVKGLLAHGAQLTQNTLLQALFGRQANIASSLITGGSAAIEDNTTALARNMTAAQAAATTDATVSGQLEVLHKMLSTVSAAIGSVFIPATASALHAVVSILQPIAAWIVANPQIATTALAVAGAVAGLGAALVFVKPLVIGAAEELIGLLGPAIALAAPVALVAAAVLGLRTGIGPVDSALDSLRHGIDLVVPPFAAFASALAALLSGSGSVGSVANAAEGLGRTLLGLASAASAWAVAAVQNVMPQVIDTLEQVGAAAAAWVADQVPKWVATAQGWIGAAADWLQTTGVPLFVNAVGVLIDKAVGVIGDGSTITAVVKQLSQWATALAAWAITAGAEAAAALVAWITATLVSKGPEIIGGLWTLASSIVSGLVQGILADPGKVAQAVLVLLTGATVVHMVAAAAGVLAEAFNAAYAAAVAAGQMLVAALRGLLLGTAVTEVAAEAGAEMGDELMASFMAVAAGPAAAAEAATAGEALASGVGAGIAGGVGIGAIATGLGTALVAAIPIALLWAASKAKYTDTTAAQKAIISAATSTGHRYAMPAGSSGSPVMIETGGASAADMAVSATTRAVDKLTGSLGAEANAWSYSAEAVQAAQNAFREGERSATASGNAISASASDWSNVWIDSIHGAVQVSNAAASSLGRPISSAIQRAHDIAVRIASSTPGDVASAIKDGAAAVTSAMGQLNADLAKIDPKTGKLKAGKAGAGVMPNYADQIRQQQTAVEAATGQLTAAQIAAIQKGHDKFAQAGLANGVAIAHGLGSSYDQIKADAGAALQGAQDQLTALQAAAGANGYSTGVTYANNLANGIATGEVSVKAALRNIGQLLHAESPPGPRSPLHEIDLWGARTGQAFVDEFARSLSGLSAAAAAPLSGAASAMAAPLAAPASASGRRGDVHVYLDGKRVSGAVSHLLFDEERTYGGAANPLSPF